MVHVKRKRTKFQERLGLPALAEPHPAEQKPVVFKGNVVVPAREDPTLAAQQARERGLQEIAVEEAAKLTKLEEVKPKQTVELEELRKEFFPDRKEVIEELPVTPTPQEFDEQGVPLLSGEVSSAEDVFQLLGPAGAAKFAAVILTKAGVKQAAKRSFKKTTLPKIKNVLAKVGKFSKSLGGVFAIGGIAGLNTVLTTGKVSELEGDITDLRGSTRDIVTDIITRAADPLEAFDAIEEIEEEIRFLSGQLQLVNSRWNNIVSRLSGKTVEPFIFRSLNAVVRRKLAVERFLITGDLNKLRILAEEVIQELELEE